MIIDAAKRFEQNAVKRRNMRAGGVDSSSSSNRSKHKVFAINEKVSLSFLDGIRGLEKDLGERINKAINKHASKSDSFREELKKLEAGNRKAPRDKIQKNGKALRSSYGVVCLRSIEIANYFHQGLYSLEDQQNLSLNQFITEIQKPLLRGLTELTYDFPDYDPIIKFLLNTNEELIEKEIEPETYEQLSRRLLVALRKGAAEHWTEDMEAAWKRVLSDSCAYLQKRTRGKTLAE